MFGHTQVATPASRYLLATPRGFKPTMTEISVSESFIYLLSHSILGGVTYLSGRSKLGIEVLSEVAAGVSLPQCIVLRCTTLVRTVRNRLVVIG